MLTPSEALKRYWGYDSFRPPQEEVIQHILDGNDGLALLPTGGGKSICFQVPGICLGGLTLVVSPLIALMKDQVERLNSLDISATYLDGSLNQAQVDRRLQAAMDGKYQFMYLAPERLKSEMFTARLDRLPLSLLAVDEAHCISQWGYDFRPAYLEINQIRQIRPEVPTLALTASATPRVEADIIDKLGLRQPNVFRKSFRRDNLRYFVLSEENVIPRIVEICRRTLGTGIVYVRTRKLTTALARVLNQQGINAAAYHGGLLTSERSQIQKAWLTGTHRVMVATNAFGMGIDKPDVRFVIHNNLPFDLESYYQEAGRGGRDGKTALAIAFNNPIDRTEMERWNRDRYPSWLQLQRDYQGLCNYFRVPNQGSTEATHFFDLLQTAKELDTSPRKLHASLKVLHLEGLIHYTEEREDYAYLQFRATPQALLQYKEHQPSSRNMLDYILRTYGGKAYTEEVRFLPAHWQMRFALKAEELDAQLQRLVHQEVITLRPASGEPTIRFLKPRHILGRQEVNWEKYEFLKAQNDHRLEEILRYVDNQEICRSLFIQQYFGEKAHEPCGRCDVCIGRFQTKVSDHEYKSIQKAIIAFLHQGPATYGDVLSKIKAGQPGQREKVLRYLLDQEVIVLSQDGRVALR